MKKVNIFNILLIVICFTLSNTCIAEALPYYDLKFKKVSENIVKGEFEKIGDDIVITEDTDITMILDKKYRPVIDISINKDEEDAISYLLGPKWNEEIKISKKEEISINNNENTYVMVRPVYKEIKGELIKDYKSWANKKEVTIKVPVDMEYTFKNMERK